MKKYLLLFSLTSVFGANAQNVIQTTQFWNNYSYYNPALNIDGARHQAGITYRNMLTNSSSQSNNLIGNYNYAINKHHAIGINYGSIFYKRMDVGYSSKTADINYSYRIQFKDSINHWLSFGIGAGLSDVKIDHSEFSSSIPTFRRTLPLLNVGVAYRYKNFMIGASVRELSNFGAYNSSFIGKRFSGHLMSSYDFRVTDNFHLKPQLFISNGIGGNLLATFNQKYSVGFGYGNHAVLGIRNTFSVNAQIDFAEKFRIGYSFDYSSKLSNVSNFFSHEIGIGFKLK